MGINKMWKRGDNVYIVYNYDDDKKQMYAPVYIKELNPGDVAIASPRNLDVPCFILNPVPKITFRKLSHSVPFKYLLPETSVFNEGYSVRKKYETDEEIFILWRNNAKERLVFSKSTVNNDIGSEFVEIPNPLGFDNTNTVKVPRNCIYLKHREVPHMRCRVAIWTWCLCARRVGVVRDVAQLIAREIWDLRDEREWE